MEFCLIYVTASDDAEAERVGRAIVEERLAACANILSGMRSLYWWEGALETGAETILILKTRRDLAEQVVEHVKALHSYDCPCAIVLPIASGNPAYLDWIGAETDRR
ncbi:divalent-cation tolerance protein CutA [Rhodospirillaceae bacterium SYSU D60014]|uniref:divalent-cation tolerance protein CutA n=1 Tax=Virgifigura deserti TaxID=2268457 RepID=UPI000E66E356